MPLESKCLNMHKHAHPALVIFWPWMLKLQFLGVFPGFKQVSLILVCPFLSLPEESSSDISPAQLFPAAGTSRAKPHLCPHLVSSLQWPAVTHSQPSRRPMAATVMLCGNVTMRPPFALHVVSVTFLLSLSPPSSPPRCEHVLCTVLISLLAVPQQQQERLFSKSSRQQALESSDTQRPCDSQGR